MKEIDYYKTCSNTRIQQEKIKTLLKKHFREDYLEYDLSELAETIIYCSKNFNAKIGCHKHLPECKLFNELIVKYADLLKRYRESEN